jgi:anti-sigma factor ChrR (cupin superfamily)
MTCQRDRAEAVAVALDLTIATRLRKSPATMEAEVISSTGDRVPQPQAASTEQLGNGVLSYSGCGMALAKPHSVQRSSLI